VKWISAGLEIADLAARFRAEHRLKIPDALHAATAVWSGSTGFVTDDPVFKRVTAFEPFVFDDV